MRIIGVDPGSVITGAGIIDIDNGIPVLVESDALFLNTKVDNISHRLKKIYDFITGKILLYKPDVLAIETAFYGKNIQSTLKLGQVRGAVMVAALNCNIEVYEYSPREIKKSITGTGTAGKESVQNFVSKILTIKSDRMISDRSDALAVSLCHFYSSFNNHIPSNSKKRNNWKTYVENNPEKIFRN